MNTPDQIDVSTALGLLRDSLAEEEQRIRNEGANAMQGGDYDTANTANAAAQRVNRERKLAAEKETAR